MLLSEWRVDVNDRGSPEYSPSRGPRDSAELLRAHAYSFS